MVSSLVANATAAGENAEVGEPLDDEISLWNGTTFELLSPTSNVAQLANTSSAPARKIARPLVQLSRYSTR